MTLPDKPDYGQPCNGCGLCCIAVQCPVSLALFGERELCPAIEQAGNAVACGLMINTANYVPDMTAWGGKVLTEAFSLMIGSGIGCDGQVEDEVVTDDARQAIRRAAFSTIMNERAKAAGNHGDREVIDLMLAHTPANKVEGAYNRAEFMPRRREIAEEWAGLLMDGMQEAEALLTLARRRPG